MVVHFFKLDNPSVKQYLSVCYDLQNLGSAILQTINAFEQDKQDFGVGEKENLSQSIINIDLHTDHKSPCDWSVGITWLCI